MSINFEPSRWDKIRETYRKWWAGELERPVLPIVLRGEDAGRPQPGTPLLTQETCHDLSISAADIIDRIDYELSKEQYFGDAFPFFNMHTYGPGVAAAFLGAELHNSTGLVWFHPKEILPISELHFEYDPNNIWLCRIKDVYAEAVKRWNGQVIMGMPDLGGTLDILSTFRPAEKLLLDLYDYPEEVTRLVNEIDTLWFKFYNEINSVLAPGRQGFSDWSRIYSEGETYILQSDFSYMISTPMFDEFTKPQLETACKTLKTSIYHLDGVGQLQHLDSLLKIKELNAVQWIPGTGQPEVEYWPEVYNKISRAGKGIMLIRAFDSMEIIAGQIGTYKGLLNGTMVDSIDKKDYYIKKLEKFGID